MLAVIPAGGRADRFGGIYKECLPIGENEYLLTSALRQAQRLGATDFAITTRVEKIATHMGLLGRHCRDLNPQAFIQTDADDLWGAIRLTFPLRRESILVLPDTVFTTRERIPQADLAFGVFTTNEPRRFSVLSGGGILFTKSKVLTGPQQAWGTVYWSAEVAAYWRMWEDANGPFLSYDNAFQYAIREFGYKTFKLDSYFDLGTWGAYSGYVRNL